jgi:signal transduction histidine kinase
MRKRRFFIKIYLWFWLATALIMGTQVAWDRVTESGPPFDHAFHELRFPLAFFGRAGIDLIQHGGIDSMSRLSELLRESTGITACLFGGPDTDKLPPGGEELGSRAISSGVLAASHSNGHITIAVPIADSEIGRLAVVGEMSQLRPPPPPPMSPARIIIVLLISGAVCYGLARYLTSPVMALQTATRRFAGGELGVRVGNEIRGRNDEFSDLGEDFNHMAQKIGSLLTLQKQLLTDISHELRSPLARLNVAIELARRSIAPKAEIMLDRMARESDLMDQMIGQVLMLSRLESGVDDIRMRPVDLTQIVQTVAIDADFEAATKHCKVVLSRSEICEVMGNEQLLRSAIENVVRNAVRYTRSGTSVEVRVERDPSDTNSVVIEICDHGPGVPQPHLENIFRPFYRVSDARDRGTGGVGLGLAITDRAVKLHRGTLACRNAEQGGLVVCISLPLAQTR